MGRNIVVIGVSAGGVETLGQLVAQLPADLKAALFVAMHFPSYGISNLPTILNKAGKLPCKHARDGEPIQIGQIHIAPPGYHLLLQKGYVRLNKGPRENGHRPSIDALFRSAAKAYGEQVIGIILTGMLDDGTAGLAVVKAKGGLAIAQDPEEAIYESMPCSAIENVAVDHILTIPQIAAGLPQFIGHSEAREMAMTPDPPVGNGILSEADVVFQDKVEREQGNHPGSPSPLTCPDCGGVLWELQQGDLIRYRCHIGHVYSADSMLAEQAEEVERALWSAVRMLEEKAALSRRMAVQARAGQRPKSGEQFEERAEEAEYNAQLVRQMILQQHAPQSRAISEPAGMSDHPEA